MPSSRFSKAVCGAPLFLANGPLPHGSAEDKTVLEVKGYIVPVRQASINAAISGRVVEMAVEVGKSVNRDEILARLDATEHEIALRSAVADLKLSQARLQSSKDHQREIAALEVEKAQAQVDLARYRVAATVIRAPFDGKVLATRAEVGMAVDPRGPRGGCICELAEVRLLEVELWIAERDVAKVAKGQRCVVRVEAYPGTTYRGQVARIGPAADRAKGSVQVRIRLDLPAGDARLLPEMGAVVKIVEPQ